MPAPGDIGFWPETYKIHAGVRPEDQAPVAGY
jgi:hypothetical protein